MDQLQLEISPGPQGFISSRILVNAFDIFHQHRDDSLELSTKLTLGAAPQGSVFHVARCTMRYDALRRDFDNTYSVTYILCILQ